MKSNQLTEVKDYTNKLIKKVNVGVPKGKLMNKAQQKNLLDKQKYCTEALLLVIDKINKVENRE